MDSSEMGRREGGGDWMESGEKAMGWGSVEILEK